MTRPYLTPAQWRVIVHDQHDDDAVTGVRVGDIRALLAQIPDTAPAPPSVPQLDGQLDIFGRVAS